LQASESRYRAVLLGVATPKVDHLLESLAAAIVLRYWIDKWKRPENYDLSGVLIFSAKSVSPVGM
jgi:hypothetical protein